MPFNLYKKFKSALKFVKQFFDSTSSSYVAVASVIIVFLVAYHINSSTCEDLSKHNAKGVCENCLVHRQIMFISLLVIVNNLLVSWNTWIFLNDVIKASEYTDVLQLDVRRRKKYSTRKTLFILAYLLTLIISLGVPTLYGFNISGVTHIDWEKLFSGSEFAALGMFFIFIVADVLIGQLFAFSKETNEKRLEKEQRYEEEKEQIQNILREIENDIKFLRNAIPLIDITGFIGILLIFLLTSLIQKYHQNTFIEGFALGAIAFHIFFTQMNFIVLKYLEKYK